MLTIQLIRNHPEDVIRKLAKKHFNAAPVVDEIVKLDSQRRQTQAQLDKLLADSNQLSKNIGQLFAKGQKDEAENMRKQSLQLKDESRKPEENLKAIEDKLNEQMVLLPNLPHDSVPEGASPEDNVVVREGGKKPGLSADAQPHWELASKYDIINFEIGTKVTGSGFPFYKGKGAKLQRALISFFSIAPSLPASPNISRHFL